MVLSDSSPSKARRVYDELNLQRYDMSRPSGPSRVVLKDGTSFETDQVLYNGFTRRLFFYLRGDASPGYPSGGVLASQIRTVNQMDLTKRAPRAPLRE